MRHSKLSEYRFLKVLHGFAYGSSPKSVAVKTGISDKTIRAVYAALRQKVMDAAETGRPVFGLGSRYLYENGKLTEKGAVFLEATAKSKVFASYMADYAPRLRDGAERGVYVFDVGMRVFTGLVLAEDEFYSISEEMQQALNKLDATQLWIDANENTPGFAQKHAETLERYNRLRRMADLVLEQNQIIALRQSGKHRYSGQLYYTDLRKHLLKNPIELRGC